MNVIDQIPVWGEVLPEALDQMKEAMKYEAVYGALMIRIKNSLWCNGNTSEFSSGVWGSSLYKEIKGK